MAAKVEPHQQSRDSYGKAGWRPSGPGGVFLGFVACFIRTEHVNAVFLMFLESNPHFFFFTESLFNGGCRYICALIIQIIDAFPFGKGS